jgi:hypothetical protein
MIPKNPLVFPDVPVGIVADPVELYAITKGPG